jgi:predicted ATP-dependent serine protease
MYTLKQSRRIRGSAGDPLPTVWKSLEDVGTKFLRGQLVLVAAAPGIGKSAFTLSYALKANVPTLYFSADSDAFTQLARSISILTGRHMAQSVAAVREDDKAVLEELPERPIRLVYDASPSLDTIELELAAWWELHNEFPHMVIIDNVTNVVNGTESNAEDPFGGLEVLMDWLHNMARKTMACVVGLHHVTGPFNGGSMPIGLNGIKGQIGRVPEMVLTLHKEDDEHFGTAALNVSTVKNRGGKSDPSGETFVSLNWDGDRMMIVDR